MAAAGSMSVAATPAPLAGASAEDQQEVQFFVYLKYDG